jgi:hypothetical protein
MTYQPSKIVPIDHDVSIVSSYVPLISVML